MMSQIYQFSLIMNFIWELIGQQILNFCTIIGKFTLWFKENHCHYSRTINPFSPSELVPLYLTSN